ncbi:ECF transporter S component [Sediminibacillus halophilus]|uniref:Energy-coupling factor transport system substrate-specific component n=1 Tax=Sediminibacillus halophilus TaxID=482461 RepID=A0A1G9LT94_9BACI|nr:ECF transporter S component [Sediminibacillus halophilus]SDL65189.1 energy-coupling factor transport system substrate-specific component [Sediminibacillus halophilus]
MSTYKLTLIAVLAALAVVGRYTFQFLPNVQPVTALIIICGFFLGPVSGVLLAGLTTYLSNLFLGMGLWTIWQIIGWALIGWMSGLIGKYWRAVPLAVMVVFAVFCGYLYGLVVSLATFSVAGNFLSYYLLGLPFDTYHAVGNGIFMTILFPVFSRIFAKYFRNSGYGKIPASK